LKDATQCSPPERKMETLYFNALFRFSLFSGAGVKERGKVFDCLKKRKEKANRFLSGAGVNETETGKVLTVRKKKEKYKKKKKIMTDFYLELM